jgi:hypothetical protein
MLSLVSVIPLLTIDVILVREHPREIAGEKREPAVLVTVNHRKRQHLTEPGHEPESGIPTTAQRKLL